MEENAGIIRLLLDAIYPNSNLPTFIPFGTLFTLTVAAEKYQMPLLLEQIRSERITLDKSLYSALEIYKIACRLGWKEETESASLRAVEMDLYSLDNQSLLQSMHVDDVVSILFLDHQKKNGSMPTPVPTMATVTACSANTK